MCDGLIDDADDSLEASSGTPWARDADGDGTGDPGSIVVACVAPADHVVLATDCDDTNPSVHPESTELCNGLDDDCDGLTDDDDDSLDESSTTEWSADSDGDGFGDPEVRVRACAAPPDHVADGTDCDDRNPETHPAATERCNGIDEARPSARGPR